jgi:hypothetical protein
VNFLPVGLGAGALVNAVYSTRRDPARARQPPSAKAVAAAAVRPRHRRRPLYNHDGWMAELMNGGNYSRGCNGLRITYSCVEK